MFFRFCESASLDQASCRIWESLSGLLGENWVYQGKTWDYAYHVWNLYTFVVPIKTLKKMWNIKKHFEQDRLKKKSFMMHIFYYFEISVSLCFSSRKKY